MVSGPDYQTGFGAIHRILYGKSEQEKWESYEQLLSALGMHAQTKIYPGVGHVDCYSREMESDCKKFADSVIDGKAEHIQSGADQILGLYQAIRHFLVSKNRIEYEQKLGQIEKVSDGLDIEEIMSGKGRNLSKNEIVQIGKLIEKESLRFSETSDEKAFKHRKVQLSGQDIGIGVKAQLKDIKGIDSKSKEINSITNNLEQSNDEQNI